MAWCCQATSHYLSQCWHRYMSPYGITRPQWVNSLWPGISECDSQNVVFSLVLLIGIFRSTLDNALRWLPQDLTDDKSTLVQVMAWCRQATSHYLSQYWHRYMSPYGFTRHQRVNVISIVPGWRKPRRDTRHVTLVPRILIWSGSYKKPFKNERLLWRNYW